MSGVDALMLGTVALVVFFQLYYLVRILWRLPLAHGPEFFLSSQVPAGFYEGPGIRWLANYRAVLVAIHGIEAVILMYLVLTRRWTQLPLLAPVFVGLFFSMFGGFVVYARRSLGARPPRLAVAISLETRRLGAYISWPLEALVVAVVAACWVLWFRARGGFAELVLETWIVMGMLPAKIILVRSGFLIPAERAEEHHQWAEASRRFSLRMIDTMRWLFLVPFAGVAVVHSWPAARTLVWFRWLVGSITVGVWFAMMGSLIFGYSRLLAEVRDLRPPGSWSGPFRRAKLMPRAAVAWAVVYMTGLALLLVVVVR